MEDFNFCAAFAKKWYNGASFSYVNNAVGEAVRLKSFKIFKRSTSILKLSVQ